MAMAAVVAKRERLASSSAEKASAPIFPASRRFPRKGLLQRMGTSTRRRSSSSGSAQRAAGGSPGGGSPAVSPEVTKDSTRPSSPMTERVPQRASTSSRAWSTTRFKVVSRVRASQMSSAARWRAVTSRCWRSRLAWMRSMKWNRPPRKPRARIEIAASMNRRPGQDWR